MRASRGAAWGTHLFTYSGALLFLLPVYVLVNLAVRSANNLSPAYQPTTSPTLSNFTGAWTQGALGPAIITSVIVTTVSCIAVLILASMAAYPLARSTARLSNTAFNFFLIGLLLPFQVATLPLYITMKDLHLLGTIWSLLLFYPGLQMPFAIFLVTSFLRSSVPIEYEESARIDGCSDARTFLYIVVPLLRPVLGTLVVLTGVSIWNDFFTPLLYLAGTSHTTVPVAIYSFVGVYSSNWPLIFGGLVISMAPMLIVFLAFQRYVIRGFAGGLKG